MWHDMWHYILGCKRLHATLIPPLAPYPHTHTNTHTHTHTHRDTIFLPFFLISCFYKIGRAHVSTPPTPRHTASATHTPPPPPHPHTHTNTHTHTHTHRDIFFLPFFLISCFY